MKVRDKVANFINKNYNNEREKMMDGMRHDFYAWEDVKTEWDSKFVKNTEEIEMKKDYQLAIEYLKQAGLYSDFETWKRSKK